MTEAKNKQLKTNQIAIILLIIVPGSKFFTLPARISAVAGRDGWIVFSLLFLLDLISLFFICKAVKTSGDMSMKMILESTVGKTASRIVFMLFALFFLTRMFTGFMGILELISSTFSIFTNWVAFSIPVVLVIVFNVCKGVKNLARITQLLFPTIFVALASVLLFSLGKGDFLNLRPVLVDGLGPVFKGISSANFWFCDAIFLLFFLGEIKIATHFTKTLSGAFVIGAAFTVLLEILFIMLFGEMASLQASALAKVSQFNVEDIANGRLDWLAVVVWLSSVLIKLSLWALCCRICLQNALFGKSKRAETVALWTISIALVFLPLFVVFESAINFVTTGFFSGLTFGMLYVFPALLVLLIKICKAKTKNKQCQSTALTVVEQKIVPANSEV